MSMSKIILIFYGLEATVHQTSLQEIQADFSLAKMDLVVSRPKKVSLALLILLF